MTILLHLGVGGGGGGGGVIQLLFLKIENFGLKVCGNPDCPEETGLKI